MSSDPRKQQKKLAKHAAKRKAKQQTLVRAKTAGLPERLAGAARYPVLHSWVAPTLWSNGLGWVCLSRELPNGFVAYAVFLVDRYCLGVKDVWGDIVGRFTYDSRVVRKLRATDSPEEFAPAALRKLVEGAVVYAQALGLPPHPDYPKFKPIFGDIDSSTCADEFEYGRDGKPYFIAGPNDTPARCRRILNALEQHCGPDGFHFTMPLSMSDSAVLPASLRGQDLRVIGPDEHGVVREHPELLEMEDDEMEQE